MTEKQEKAVLTFKAGYNCAQSVLAAFAIEMNFDNKLAFQLASGFLGGMGKQQKTCGAITGAYMVLGIKNAQQITENDLLKKENVKDIRHFTKEFTKLNQFTDCIDLVKYDINTEEGLKKLKEDQLDVKVCQKCIADAVLIVENLIN